MTLEVTLWFLAGLLVLATANLFIGTVFMRRRAPVLTASTVPVLDVLALALLTLVVTAAMIINVQLVFPAAPALGRPALSVIGAVLIEVLRRLFAVLPSAPRWLLGLLGILETLLLALGVIGIILMVLLRQA